MHVVSHGGGSGGGGSGGGLGGMGSVHGGKPRNFKRANSSHHLVDRNKSGGREGGGGHGGTGLPPITEVKSSNKRNQVYRIGNQKFTLDGKDGKTLDDVIEVNGKSIRLYWKQTNPLRGKTEFVSNSHLFFVFTTKMHRFSPR